MSFDILASHYRWMEGLLAGEKLQRCRTAYLKEISPPAHALICGEGNGRFLAAFCRRFPETRITCVDASAQMLAQAAKRLSRAGLASSHVQFVHADILTWTPPPATFDQVITHFFLDCFRPDQIEQIVASISQATTPQAQWLLADFKVAEAGFPRLRGRLILAVMYAFFRYVTRLPARRLTPPDPYLAGAGFTLKARQEIEWGLLHTDWWSRSQRASA